MDIKPRNEPQIAPVAAPKAAEQSSGAQTLPLPVVQTPFCGDLRSKKYYMRDQIITTADEFYDASGHVWCYHTQMAIGPDGMRASPEGCGPDRHCYRSALDKPAEYVFLPTTRVNNEA